MTHEAGIEEAAEMLVIEMYPDPPDMQGARHSARLIVEAYLSASGMVLVPREMTARMISEGESAASIGIGRCNDDEAMPRVWSSMLAVAPDPFKSKP